MTDQADLLRRKDTGQPGNPGQFAASAREASGLSLHGEGPRSGSALFPPPFGGWTAEEYIDWWTNVPLDDDGVLMNVQEAYQENVSARRHEHINAVYSEWLRTHPDRGAKASFREADEWEKGANATLEAAGQAFDAAFPPSIPDTRVRGVYRAYKMWQYGGQLDEAERPLVLEHQIQLGPEVLTVRAAADKYRLDLIRDETRKTISDAMMGRLFVWLEGRD